MYHADNLNLLGERENLSGSSEEIALEVHKKIRIDINFFVTRIALRRRNGPEMEEVIERRRKLHNEELHNSTVSIQTYHWGDTIKEVKAGGTFNTHGRVQKFLYKNTKGNPRSGELYAYLRIIL
jgi:hypothetical protein